MGGNTKPCQRCDQLKMEKVGGIFHWVCVHKTIGRDFGGAATVVAGGWQGLPDGCPAAGDDAKLFA